MKGMQAVADLRRMKLKPLAVYVQLVHAVPINEARCQVTGMGHTGIVTVQIAKTESLADIDFRPLTGLSVCVEDCVGDIDRHRQAAQLVARVKPETLWMPQVDGEQLALHIRRQGDPSTTESHQL